MTSGRKDTAIVTMISLKMESQGQIRSGVNCRFLNYSHDKA